MENEESKALWHPITTTVQPMPYSEVFLRKTQYTKSFEEDLRVLRECGFIIDMNRGSIGSGCFGSVYKGIYGPQAEGLKDDKNNPLRNVSPGQPFAVKLVDFLAKRRTPESPHVGVIPTQELRESYEMEKWVMNYVKHPNITTIQMAINMGEPKTFIYGKNRQKFTQHDRVYLIMDFAELGPLQRYYLNDSLQSAQRIKLVRDLFAGLRYLHSEQIAHGDIHWGNVLIFREEGEVIAKWADFGKSFVSGRGELSYNSIDQKIEILKTLNNRIKVDCHRFALIVTQIWMNFKPNLESKDMQQICERFKEMSAALRTAENLDETAISGPSESLLKEDIESETQSIPIMATNEPTEYKEISLGETQYTKNFEEDKKVLRESGFILEGFLGSGCFGSVYKGVYGPQAEGLVDKDKKPLKNVRPNLPFAAKAVDFSINQISMTKDSSGPSNAGIDEKAPSPLVAISSTGQDRRESYEVEKLAMTFADHPNITQIRMAINMGEPKTFTYKGNPQKHFIQHQRVYLIMDFAELGCLRQYLRKPLKSDQRIKLVRDCFAGLRFLHSKQIAHGDIHWGNVIIFKEEGEVVAKWADFGKSFVSGRGELTYDSLDRKAEILKMFDQRIKLDCERFGYYIVGYIWIDWKPDLEPGNVRQKCAKHLEVITALKAAKNLEEVWNQYSDVLSYEPFVSIQ